MMTFFAATQSTAPGRRSGPRRIPHIAMMTDDDIRAEAARVPLFTFAAFSRIRTGRTRRGDTAMMTDVYIFPL